MNNNSIYLRGKQDSIYLCGKEVYLDDVLLAHTELLKMVSENVRLCDMTSYAEFENYIKEIPIWKDGKFLPYADTICDQLGQPYGLIERSLCNINMQRVSFKAFTSYHPETDFRYLNLEKSNLSGSDLRGIDLSYSNLCGTKLLATDCSGAKFTGCSTDHDTDFTYANLIGSFDVTFVPFACPEKGEFIGWKRVKDYLVKLKIPEDAKRSSATSYKCRCDKAFVLRIYNLDGSDADLDELNVDARGLLKNHHEFEQITAPITYKVGEIAYADSFDDDRWNECSHGIHFFTDYRMASQYTDRLIDAERGLRLSCERSKYFERL